MSLQLGMGAIFALGALWIAYRMRKPNVLPPPDRSVASGFKFYVAHWTRDHAESLRG